MFLGVLERCHHPRMIRPRILADNENGVGVFELLQFHAAFSDSDALAQEIVDDLEAALEQFRKIAADLGANRGKGGEL